MLFAEIESGARNQKVGMTPAWNGNETNNAERKIHRIGAWEAFFE